MELESRPPAGTTLGNTAMQGTSSPFANEFYFSRIFKKFEGISPSEYLKCVRDNATGYTIV